MGIDLERIRPVPDAEHVASRFFSAQENARLQSLPNNRKQTAFLTYWVRKEAVLKAHGGGLSLALDEFDVSSLADDSAILQILQNASEEPRSWSVHDLEPGRRYMAALAVEV